MHTLVRTHSQMRAFDSNGDGRVSYREFFKVLSRERAGSRRTSSARGRFVWEDWLTPQGYEVVHARVRRRRASDGLAHTELERWRPVEVLDREPVLSRVVAQRDAPAVTHHPTDLDELRVVRHSAPRPQDLALQAEAVVPPLPVDRHERARLLQPPRRDILAGMDFRHTARDGDEKIFHMGTFNAVPTTCAAGIAALDVVCDTDVCQRAIDYGETLIGKLNEMFAAEAVSWIAYGTFGGFHIFLNPQGMSFSLKTTSIEIPRFPYTGL